MSPSDLMIFPPQLTGERSRTILNRQKVEIRMKKVTRTSMPSYFVLPSCFVTAVAAAVILATLPWIAAPQSARAHEFSRESVTIAHPWARATPPGARVGAAYLEIKASQKSGDKLIGARADGIASRVEIHTHEADGDVVKMRELASLDIAPGSSVVFSPAGHHLMLIDLVKPLEEGDLIKFALVFEKAGAIEVEATVEPIGAKGPHGMDHQPGQGPGEHSGHDMQHGTGDHKH